jgi:3-phenylpropionate/trans-cinnamate dioxygenase ferredoxin component
MTAAIEGFVTIAVRDQIPEGTLKVFHVGENRIAVSRVEGHFYAIEDICTHDEGPLGEGTLQGEEVECPRHGARFSVKTGAALSMPAVMPVKIYQVRVEGENVQVRLK